MRRIAVAVAVATLLACAAALAAAPAPIPTKDAVAGIPQSELTKRWWQWGFAFPPDESPLTDRTGARCTVGQEGPVWFLAGVVGEGPVQRTCHVPGNRPLFFPVVAYIYAPRDPSSSCADLIRGARGATDSPMLFAELDGEPIADLEKRRLASGNCFNAGTRGTGDPELGLAASNGYWLAFPPLSKGRHRLHFGGTLPKLRQDITYTLIVE